MLEHNFTPQNETILGHPKGLFVLFMTEMWERFSFYGMKAILIFYLIKYHLFSDTEGNLIVGSYAAMVYAMPVIGGYLADKYLGFRKAVTYGGIMLVLGHIGMAFEGNAATESTLGIVRDERAIQIFFLSLSLIVLGVGFLKANISSIVGSLYEENDARRDGGFTIFYMGINLGSFLATIICSWLGETYGWSYGFGAAGIGMLLGLVVFVFGSKYFNDKSEPKDPVYLASKVGGITREWWIYILSTLSVVIVWSIIQHHKIVEGMLVFAAVTSLIFILRQLAFSGPVERDRLIALTILIVFSVVFWALFEQAYTSLNLFAERSLDRNLPLFGEVAAGSFLSLNALFIILFAPVFAWLWVRLNKNNMEPNTAVKFGLAILLVGLGFGALVLGGKAAGTGKVAAIWLVLAYLLHTFGELCLSPVGLSSVTKLSPARIVGFMMGVWFLATAGAEYVSVLLANLASIDTSGGEITDPVAATAAYMDLFYKLFLTGSIIGILLLVASPLIKKLMHGIK